MFYYALYINGVYDGWLYGSTEFIHSEDRALMYLTRHRGEVDSIGMVTHFSDHPSWIAHTGKKCVPIEACHRVITVEEFIEQGGSFMDLERFLA